MSTATESAVAGEQTVQLFLDGVKDYAIFMLDAHGRMTSWNRGAEMLLGYTAAEAIGQHFGRTFIPDDVRAGRPEEELRLAEAHGQVSAENWHVRKDGTRFWASEVTTALRDHLGRLQGFAKVMRDTTDRKRLEMELRRQADELAEMDRRKDEFLAMLSHELRNPLAPVLNSVHVLLHAAQGPDLVRSAAAMIERQVRHMARMIDDLLEVTRITRGKLSLRPERLDLAEAARRAADAAAPLMKERGHEFTCTTPPTPAWVDADPTRLDQVLANLLNNAAKYTDQGGRVELLAARDGPDAVLRVRDNGMGIPPSLLPRLFDLFAQADRSLDRGRGGLGLGLTLVRNLVAMHGGTVEARSEGEGKGAEFVVRLPAAEAPPDQPPPSEPPARLLRLLVVDDSPDNAASLAMLLRLLGHQAVTAHSGPEALAHLEGAPFDVLLLDIGLPGMDGYELARRVRQQPRTPRPLLVAISGYGFEEDRRRSREAGFDHHLVKPASPEALQALLAQPPAPG